MKRPLIGINCKLAREEQDQYYKLDRHYVQAIEKAGAIPVLLPFFKSVKAASQYLERLDGMLFTGGADLNPARWGEPIHPQAQLLLPEKEESDFCTARAALQSDKPTLGICLGMQLLNVAFGGSLHQHIEGHSEGKRHEVQVEGSRLREGVGKHPKVNSYHHQAVHRLGKGLQATATAPDGVIEGIESNHHRWIVGVQWHPERIVDQPEQLRLFRSFLSACR